jgi:hypothetical protein
MFFFFGGGGILVVLGRPITRVDSWMRVAIGVRPMVAWLHFFWNLFFFSVGLFCHNTQEKGVQVEETYRRKEEAKKQR